MANAQNLPEPSLPPQGSVASPSDNSAQQNVDVSDDAGLAQPTPPQSVYDSQSATAPDQSGVSVQPLQPAQPTEQPDVVPAGQGTPSQDMSSSQPVSGVSQSPPVSNRLLENLQSVNPTPFQDSSTVSNANQMNMNGAAAQNENALGTVGSVASSENTGNSGGGVPQESVGFTASPFSSNGAGGNPSAPTSSDASNTHQSSTNTLKSARSASILDQVRESMAAKIGLGLLVCVLLLAGGFFIYRSFFAASPTSLVENPDGTGGPAGTTTTLTYWGLWEPEEVMAPLIAQYEAQNPGVRIEYVQQRSEQYRERVQAAIQEGNGPDIFRFHNTWVPMVEDELAPAPPSIFSASELEQDFYPLMSRDLVVNNEVYGVPLMYEGLALLYNRSMLESAAAQPPQDWNQVRSLASQLTIRDGERIERAGIALGTAENVDHFSDILGLMLLQNSANPADPTSVNVQHALEFYTIFSRSDRVWDSTFPSSVDAFANEQVAMIFAPSWRIFEIQRTNPNINIGVVRTPQLGGTTVTWGTYWAEGVSAQSRNKQAAWRFLAYLAQEEQLRTFHDEGASYRAFGELYPRVEMSTGLTGNPLIQPYLEDALYARSWYLASQTHDEGVNDQMIQYYTDAVNAAVQSGNVSRALQGIEPGIQQVLTRYSIPAPLPATQ